MNKVNIVFLAFITLITSATVFAADFSQCDGQYLLSVRKENQTAVYNKIVTSVAAKVIRVSSYNPNVGPYGIYAIETASSENQNAALELMQTFKDIPGLIAECNSTLAPQSPGLGID